MKADTKVRNDLFHLEETNLEKREEAFDAKQIYEHLKQASVRPIIRFEVEKKNEISPFDMKIGGAYYLPEGEKPPVNIETGKELYLLAQLDFSKIPHIQDFPQKGILQIFIAGDNDMAGMNCDDPFDQTTWCIRYYENVEHPDILKDVHHTNCDDSDISLPFSPSNTYVLTPYLDEQVISLSDYRFNDVLKESCKDILPEDVTRYYDLDDDTLDQLYDMLETCNCQMGGYPYFTQYDHRAGMPEYDVLLFQLDSVEDIMWGDCGVAKFFMTWEALRKCDFSEVMYQWDCC